MGRSYMEEVAELLNIELLEEFKLKNREPDTFFQLTVHGLRARKENEGWQWAEDYLLIGLLTGTFEIIKLPYIPKYGDWYYSYQGEKAEVIAAIWEQTFDDYLRLKNNIVFKNVADARAARPAIYKKLTGEEWKR